MKLPRSSIYQNKPKNLSTVLIQRNMCQTIMLTLLIDELLESPKNILIMGLI